MEKVVSVLAKDRIASILREAILLGKIKPGQKLVEIELCEQLGVSRTPLREAIRNLEVEGLVESIPNKGSRVRTMTIKDIKNIYELRIELEALATKKSVPFLTDNDLDNLSHLQEKIKIASEKRAWGEVDHLNKEFHSTLMSKGGNDQLINIIDQLYKISVIISISTFSIPGRINEVIEEHDKILDACLKKESELTGELMKKHLENARDKILNYVKNY